MTPPIPGPALTTGWESGNPTIPRGCGLRCGDRRVLRPRWESLFPGSLGGWPDASTGRSAYGSRKPGGGSATGAARADGGGVLSTRSGLHGRGLPHVWWALWGGSADSPERSTTDEPFTTEFHAWVHAASSADGGSVRPEPGPCGVRPSRPAPRRFMPAGTGESSLLQLAGIHQFKVEVARGNSPTEPHQVTSILSFSARCRSSSATE